MKLNFSTEPSPSQWLNWHWQLEHAAHSIEEAAELLGVAPEKFASSRLAAARYPLFVTPYYLSLAESAELSDPIIRQCMPNDDEINCQQGGAPDALAEDATSPVPRLVHRYTDRALFVTGNICAMHCRHCMRKRDWCKMLPLPTDDELAAAVEYLKSHGEVREVLISGGDPLMLPEESLEKIIKAFSAVPSVEMLRIGSRVPCVLPMRITPRLAAIISSGKPAWLATHFNHPRELTQQVSDACGILNRGGVPIVNQSVLLKGVNDNAETLGKLFTSLLRYYIKPYYLFHGDPIEGAMHFRTGIEAGLKIMDELRGRISGMALPAFAFDLPDGNGKIRLQPEKILGRDENGAPIFKSWQKKEISYPN
ncbi:MAG: KamA family radical SAM protein [Lentisphaeria bacterium]|nr:KamA family radical SAM protein [Lentisphaeria bacterium]